MIDRARCRVRRLEFGEVVDAGYGEIMCTPEYAEVLMGGAMTHVNGRPVRLQIVDRGLKNIGAVILRVMPYEELRELRLAA